MDGLGAADPFIFWLASNPAATLKLYYNVSDDGLAILHEDGTTAGEPDDTEDYVPDWIVAPRNVTTGLVVASNGSYNGSELGPHLDGHNSGHVDSQWNRDPELVRRNVGCPEGDPHQQLE